MKTVHIVYVPIPVIIALMLKQHVYEPLAAVCQIHLVKDVGIIFSQVFFYEAVLADFQGIQIHQIQHRARKIVDQETAGIFLVAVCGFEYLVMGIDHP